MTTTTVRWSAADLAQAVGTPPPTPQQAAVIEAPPEAHLVVAGAGSGKTETMAARVVWLVANGLVDPAEVLGLTFTRKAAMELGDRIGRRLRTLREAGIWHAEETDPLALPTVSTYHAYAGRLVAEHGLRLGIEPDTRLLTEAASWQVASEVVAGFDGDLEGVEQAASTLTEAVISLTGELAEHLVEPVRAVELLEDLARRVEALPGRDGGRPLAVARDTARQLRDMARVYPVVERYRAALRERGAMDFAEQMSLAARLARDVPLVGQQERERFRAVLLDEFQDTSEAQLVLLEALFAVPGLPVTAVGDPNQSIYGWRGASATTLQRFRERFGPSPGQPAPVLPLSTSWRNATRVLTVANRTAAPLRVRSQVEVEQLRPRPGAPDGVIEAARVETHEEEARLVARWVARRWFTSDGRPSGRSVAVLCRNRAQFDGVVRALRAEQVPVEVVGLGGLLSAPEVADVVALLTVVQDPTRGDQLMRLLTGPVCRLGPADLDGLWAWARELHRRGGADDDAVVLSEALHTLPPEGWTDSRGRALGRAARARVAELGAVVERLRAMAGLPLPDLILQAERLLGLDVEIAADPDQPAAWARAQLDALGEVAQGFSASAERPTLGGFVDWLEAARARERGLEPAEVTVSSQAVQVMTVHAAKGLEWDAVAVPGLAEGIFPAYTARSTWADGEWVVSEPQDAGWLTGLGSLPYPLRGDADGLPQVPWRSLLDTTELRDELREHRRAGGAHKLAEERRLAYVAFTRAREELLLTAPVWSTGTTPRVTSRFLTELLAADDVPLAVTAWAPMPVPGPDGRAVNPLLERQTRTDWPLPRDEDRREARELVATVVEAQAALGPPDEDRQPDDYWTPLLDLLLAERERARDEGRPAPERHLSTSALLALAEDPELYRRRRRRPLPRPPAASARAGTAFHSWVEHHFAAATLLDLDDLLDEEPTDAVEGTAAAVTEPEVRWRENFLRSPWAQRAPEAVEVPVETVIAGVPVRGRIDAVFPDDDGGVTLVDWKTGSGADGDAERHALQLSAYRVAYARLRGMPLEQVRAALYYTDSGRTVTPGLLGEEELEDLVAGLTRS